MLMAYFIAHTIYDWIFFLIAQAQSITIIKNVHGDGFVPVQLTLSNCTDMFTTLLT